MFREIIELHMKLIGGIERMLTLLQAGAGSAPWPE
jgi:hypothetical protein